MNPTVLIVCVMLALTLFCILLVLFIKCVLSCLDSTTLFRSHNWKTYENETYEIETLSLQSVNLQHVPSSVPLVYTESTLIQSRPPNNEKNIEHGEAVLQDLGTHLAEDAVNIAVKAANHEHHEQQECSKGSSTGCFGKGDSGSAGSDSVDVECFDFD